MPRLTRTALLPTLFIAIALSTACEHARTGGTLTPFGQPIDTRLTLGQWRATHSGDSVAIDVPTALAAPQAGIDGRECRVATGQLAIGGLQFTRGAVFVVGEPPTGQAIPNDTNALADRICTLESIVAARTSPTVSDAAAVADSATDALRRDLGAPKIGAGRDLRRGVRSLRAWSRGATTIQVVELDSGSTTDEMTGATTHRPFEVLVLARDTSSSTDPTAPDLRLDGEYAAGGNEEALDAINARYLDSAITLVDVAPAAAVLREIAPRLRKSNGSESPSGVTYTPTLDSLFARLIRTVNDSTPSLDAHRRARLALATDLAVAGYAAMLPLDSGSAGRATHDRLRAAGVPFDDDSAESVAVYTRRWAHDAFAADSTSDAGRMALVVLSANGWASRAACRDTTAGSDQVIAHGETAFAAGATNPVLHYLVGEAYQDSVAFASGALREYLGDRFIGRTATQARAKAIDHFRAALAEGLQDPALRRAAWTYAVHLMLGIHVPTTFLCIND